MISIKTAEDIQHMRKAGRLAYDMLEMVSENIQAGISTAELNDLCHRFALKHGAKSAPLNYGNPPFPGSICTSVNEVVCHGIPNQKTILAEGDIINVDVTPLLNAFHGDSSRTFFVGEPSKEAKLLVDRTKKAMEIGIQSVVPGGFFSDIGNAIDRYLKPFGYGIVRDLGGHGIGKKFHEEPMVFHHKQKKKKGEKFRPGMTFTIEPMINQGTWEVFIDPDDKWTVYTKDGKLSAQFEHTVLVTHDGVEVLTLP